MKTLYTLIISCAIASLSGQTSLSLTEAINIAIDNSNMMKLKHIEASDAKAQVQEIKSIGMPVVTAGVDYSYYFATPSQPIADFITPSIYNVLFSEELLPERELGPPAVSEISFFQPHNLNAKVDASMLIFDQSYLNGLKAAKLFTNLVEMQKDITLQEIKTNVTKAYMAVLIAQKNDEILERNLNNVNKSLNDVTVLFEEGFAESLDVERLNLSANQLAAEKKKVEQLIQVSFNVLKYQMGASLNDAFTLTENIEDLEKIFSTVNTIASTEEIDFNQRAEYKLFDQQTLLNEIDYNRNRSFMPSVRIFANLSESLQRQDLFDNDEAGWLPSASAGIGINLPILDGGERAAKRQRAKLNIEKVQVEKEEFEKGVTLQVINASLALQNAKTSLDNTKTALDITQRIFDKTKIKFNEGVGSSLEMTQAESALYQAQADYINALYDLLIAKTDLDTARGTL